MSDFEDAYKRGLQAYHDALRARREVMSILEQVSEAVLRQTENKVRIVYVKSPPSTLQAMVDAVRRASSDMLSEALRKEDPDALFALRVGGGKGDFERLCAMKRAAEGYPVEVIYPGNVMRAEDSESLTHVLVTLLSQPDIAGKIERVSKIEVPPASSGGAPPLPPPGSEPGPAPA